MGKKTDVWQGTLALMVLKTLDTMGPLHGYGLARRIEQTSGNLLSVNYGTLYPALLKLEQEGRRKWLGTSESAGPRLARTPRSRRRLCSAEIPSGRSTAAGRSGFAGCGIISA